MSAEVEVARDDLLLVLQSAAFDDPRFALKVEGVFASESPLDTSAGPLADPADVAALVGRRVEYSYVGLRSGGLVVSFESERDLQDVACALSQLPGVTDLSLRRATISSDG